MVKSNHILTFEVLRRSSPLNLIIMNLVNHTREVNGIKEVNAVGYFNSEFFNFDDLIQRQKEIYTFLTELGEDKKEAKVKAEDLYNVTEQMRVTLLNSISNNMDITNYKSVIKKGYENRVNDFRNYIAKKSIALGEDVMPSDVSEIMDKADNRGKYKHLLFNGFTSCFGKMLLMIDIYEGLGGYEIPYEYRKLTVENLQTYF